MGRGREAKRDEGREGGKEEEKGRKGGSGEVSL